jgi:hypothetical protein
MFGAARKPKLELIEVERDQIAQVGRFNAVQLVGRAVATLQDLVSDEVRLKDADVNARVAQSRIPHSRNQVSRMGIRQPYAQLRRQQQTIQVFRIDRG